MWDNGATERDKMTVQQWLDKLTDENWHTERVLVEAIIDGRSDLIRGACKVCIDHLDKGYMTDENLQKRTEIIKAIDEE